MQRSERWLGFFGLGLALSLGAACGDDPAPAANVAAVETESEDEWFENSIPEILSVRLEPDSPSPGGQVTAQVRASDDDGDELEYGFAWRVNGRPVPSDGATLALVNAMKGDPVSVSVTVSDGWDESEPYVAQTQLGNTRPIVSSIVFDPLGTIHRGRPVTARPIASDPDGDALEFEYKWWVNERELSDTSDLLDTSRLKRGDEVRVEVVATDGYSRSNAVKSAPILVDNSPPEITSSPGNAGQGATYLYQVQASDPDGDRRLRFRLEQAPSGMVIDPITGQLSWTPPGDAVGSHAVEVVVDDLQGGTASQRFTVDISEEPVKPAGQTTASAGAPAAAAEER